MHGPSYLLQSTSNFHERMPTLDTVGSILPIALVFNLSGVRRNNIVMPTPCARYRAVAQAIEVVADIFLCPAYCIIRLRYA